MPANQNYSDAYSDLGMVQVKSGRSAEAISSFKQATAFNTGNSTAQYGLGRAYLQQGTADEDTSFKTDFRIGRLTSYRAPAKDRVAQQCLFISVWVKRTGGLNSYCVRPLRFRFMA